MGRWDLYSYHKKLFHRRAGREAGDKLGNPKVQLTDLANKNMGHAVEF